MQRKEEFMKMVSFKELSKDELEDTQGGEREGRYFLEYVKQYIRGLFNCDE